MYITMFLIFVGAIVLMGLGNRVTRTLGILDRPGKDVPKRKAVPTLQGIVMLIAFVVLGVVFLPQNFVLAWENPFLGLYIGGGIIVLLSFVDELGLLVHKKFQISSGIRLLGQMLAIGVAYRVSGVGIEHFQLPSGELLVFNPINSLLLTVGRYLLFINALNRFDGVYGLASGTGSIGFLTIFLLLFLIVIPGYPDISLEKLTLLQHVGMESWLLFSVAVVACVLEWKPWGLLRDVGTMFIGFALAYLGLLGGAKIGMMIVVLALPLFDAIFVIVDRLHRRKKNPFHGDHSHLHYRLLALGRNRNEVRTFLLSTTLFLMTMMLLLGTDRIGKVIILLLTAVIFFGVNGYLYWVKGFEVEYRPKIKN